MKSVNEDQLALDSAVYLKINQWGPLALDAECVHGTVYRFIVASESVVHMSANLGAPINLPSRFGVPQTYPELVDLAHRVLASTPCHHYKEAKK